MSLITEKTAYLFPGQGSQSVGMGYELAASIPIARDVFNEADEILGFHLSKLAWEGPEDLLNDTVNTQPALFVHSIAVLRVFQGYYPDFVPIFIAGHSMGELSALIAAGATRFKETLLLVKKRGELMKQAGEISPGGMAAILGLDILSLQKLCIKASTSLETVQVANDNCPGQVVVSGARPAVERLLDMANAAGARRTISLPVSIAAHSPLMAHAQLEFNHAVDSISINPPQIPIIGNISAQPMTTKEQICGDLKAQLTSRVRWTESLEYMLSQGVHLFIELGNGSVLTSLLKRISKQAIGVSLGNPMDFNKIG